MIENSTRRKLQTLRPPLGSWTLRFVVEPIQFICKAYGGGGKPRRRCLAIAIADGELAFVELPSHARTKIERLVGGDWSRLVGDAAPEVRLWTDGWEEKRIYEAWLLPKAPLPADVNPFEMPARLRGYTEKARTHCEADKKLRADLEYKVLARRRKQSMLPGAPSSSAPRHPARARS